MQWETRTVRVQTSGVNKSKLTVTPVTLRGEFKVYNHPVLIKLIVVQVCRSKRRRTITVSTQQSMSDIWLNEPQIRALIASVEQTPLFQHKTLVIWKDYHNFAISQTKRMTTFLMYPVHFLFWGFQKRKSSYFAQLPTALFCNAEISDFLDCATYYSLAAEGWSYLRFNHVFIITTMD